MPMRKSPRAKRARRKSRNSAANASLVAEDNELNWEIAYELLQEVGLKLEWAENGQICADMFRRSEPGYYDGILMDIRMPVMNGYEATDAIRAMDRPDASPTHHRHDGGRLLGRHQALLGAWYERPCGQTH